MALDAGGGAERGAGRGVGAEAPVSGAAVADVRRLGLCLEGGPVFRVVAVLQLFRRDGEVAGLEHLLRFDQHALRVRPAVEKKVLLVEDLQSLVRERPALGLFLEHGEMWQKCEQFP